MFRTRIAPAHSSMDEAQIADTYVFRVYIVLYCTFANKSLSVQAVIVNNSIAASALGTLHHRHCYIVLADVSPSVWISSAALL